MFILIFLSKSFFNSFMKMKNEKRTVFRCPCFMKMYLHFVFHIEVKTRSNYKILDFVSQFITNLKWHFGYTDYEQQ